MNERDQTNLCELWRRKPSWAHFSINVKLGPKVSKTQVGTCCKSPCGDGQRKEPDARETTTRQVPQLTQPGGGSLAGFGHILFSTAGEAAGRPDCHPALHPTSVSTAGNWQHGQGKLGNKLRKRNPKMLPQQRPSEDPALQLETSEAEGII